MSARLPRSLTYRLLVLSHGASLKYRLARVDRHGFQISLRRDPRRARPSPLDQALPWRVLGPVADLRVYLLHLSFCISWLFLLM